MTAKQFLGQAYRLDALISSDLAELEQLRSLAGAVPSPNLSGMPGGARNTEAPFVRRIEKIDALERKVNEEIDRLVELKESIRCAIGAVRDVNERLLLRLRYIEFLPWDAIAERMHYSNTQVFRIHGNALKHVKVPRGEKEARQ